MRVGAWVDQWILARRDPQVLDYGRNDLDDL